MFQVIAVFSDINISQGKVATRLRFRGIIAVIGTYWQV